MREITAGEKLDQYQLSDLLARSGMASIFKATDTDTGAAVALKVPHPQFESDVVFFERFRREEEIGQKIDHPNIVKVLKPREKSRMYMAMEYVDGRSLRAMMSEARVLPTEKALDIARQVAEALAYLHGKGVVHRDIKPENILLTADGSIKLLDFGIALDESARRLTWFGLSNPVGTPDYMAPEQIGGRRGDARTDVYAVGTLLYEMLTGNLPFSSPNPHALLRAKANDEPKAPTYFVPNFDPALETIILRAIERNPRERYPSAAELLADLRNPAGVAPRDPNAPRSRSRRALVPTWARTPIVVVVVLTALAGMVWLSRGRTPGADAPGGANAGAGTPPAARGR
jgi:serine/threonine protein kinase